MSTDARKVGGQVWYHKNEMHWCTACKVFVNKRPSSMRTHEQGEKHKNNVLERVKRIERERAAADRNTRETEEELRRVERVARLAYKLDDDYGKRKHGIVDDPRTYREYKGPQQAEQQDIDPHELIDDPIKFYNSQYASAAAASGTHAQYAGQSGPSYEAFLAAYHTRMAEEAAAAAASAKAAADAARFVAEQKAKERAALRAAKAERRAARKAREEEILRQVRAGFSSGGSVTTLLSSAAAATMPSSSSSSSSSNAAIAPPPGLSAAMCPPPGLSSSVSVPPGLSSSSTPSAAAPEEAPAEPGIVELQMMHAIKKQILLVQKQKAVAARDAAIQEALKPGASEEVLQKAEALIREAAVLSDSESESEDEADTAPALESIENDPKVAAARALQFAEERYRQKSVTHEEEEAERERPPDEVDEAYAEAAAEIDEDTGMGQWITVDAKKEEAKAKRDAKALAIKDRKGRVKVKTPFGLVTKGAQDDAATPAAKLSVAGLPAMDDEGGNSDDDDEAKFAFLRNLKHQMANPAPPRKPGRPKRKAEDDVDIPAVKVENSVLNSNQAAVVTTLLRAELEGSGVPIVVSSAPPQDVEVVDPDEDVVSFKKKKKKVGARAPAPPAAPAPAEAAPAGSEASARSPSAPSGGRVRLLIEDEP